MKFINLSKKVPKTEVQISSSDMKTALTVLIQAAEQSAYSEIISRSTTRQHKISYFDTERLSFS